MRRSVLARVLALALFVQGSAAPVQARVDPLQGLAVHQREYCENPSRRRVLTGGRRSGKTEALVADLCATAMRGGACVYISLTRKLAKRTVWLRLKARLRTLNVAFTPNETELRLELAGGGTIEVGGADDREAIERYRGLAYALVVIDECGAHSRELLRVLVTDVLRPALMDYEGRLTLAGTPSPVLDGYWYDQAGPQRSSRSPRWEWTIYDNPLFAGRADAELDAVLEENEWDRKSVSFRREYLGEWVQDDSVLVYPYDPARNGVESLPERTPKGYPVDPRRWRHVIGVDVGTTKEAMAISVLAAHPALSGEFMVHAEAHTEMLTDTLIGRLQVLLVRFPKATIVIDSAASGMHLELQAVGLPVVGSRKSDKALAIRVLHDRVVSGRFKLLLLPSLDGVRKEWRKLGWDDDHLQHHPDQSDHYSDATLYALRELRHYYSREDMAKPPKDLRQVDLEEEDEDERQVVDARERQRERGWAHRLRLALGRPVVRLHRVLDVAQGVDRLAHAAAALFDHGPQALQQACHGGSGGECIGRGVLQPTLALAA